MECSTRSGLQGDSLLAEGQGTRRLWAMATAGDVSPLGPGNPFTEPLDLREPPDGCWPDVGQSLPAGF